MKVRRSEPCFPGLVGDDTHIQDHPHKAKKVAVTQVALEVAARRNYDLDRGDQREPFSALVQLQLQLLPEDEQLLVGRSSRHHCALMDG